ncbi:unnamed protein product [Spodoptera littoralis]|uniref:Uncharacterized protein n=1 Tax=Spodoptera littoralis TaxID=7109 RepID=A0A9P0IAY5_SPOLI|nr:unnamed protein product [Spodoptera littoralis]
MKMFACVLLVTIFAHTNTLPQQPEDPDKNVNLALETVLEFSNKYQSGEEKLLNVVQNFINRLKGEMHQDKRSKSGKHSRRSSSDSKNELEILGLKIIDRLNYLENQVDEIKQNNALKDCPTDDKNQTVNCFSRSSSGRDINGDGFVKLVEVQKGSLRQKYNITDDTSEIVIRKCDKCNVSRIYRKILKTNVRETNEAASSNHTDTFMTTSNLKLYQEELNPHHHHHNRPRMNTRTRIYHTTAKSSDEVKFDQTIVRLNKTKLSLDNRQRSVDLTTIATEATSTVNLTLATNEIIRNFSRTFPLSASYVPIDGRKFNDKNTSSIGELIKELNDRNFESKTAKDKAISNKVMDFFSLPHNPVFRPSNVW